MVEGDEPSTAIIKRLEELRRIREDCAAEGRGLIEALSRINLRSIKESHLDEVKSTRVSSGESGPFSIGDYVWIKTKITHVEKSSGSPHGRHRVATIIGFEEERVLLRSSIGTRIWRLEHNIRHLTIAETTKYIKTDEQRKQLGWCGQPCNP